MSEKTSERPPEMSDYDLGAENFERLAMTAGTLQEKRAIISLAICIVVQGEGRGAPVVISLDGSLTPERVSMIMAALVKSIDAGNCDMATLNNPHAEEKK